MARRRRPVNIWSDNGTNFVETEKEEALKRLDSERIGDQLSNERVQGPNFPPDVVNDN